MCCTCNPLALYFVSVFGVYTDTFVESKFNTVVIQIDSVSCMLPSSPNGPFPRAGHMIRIMQTIQFLAFIHDSEYHNIHVQWRNFDEVF